MERKFQYKINKFKVVMVLLSFAFCSTLLTAQTIEKFSIDSGGAIASSGNIQVLYTIGEVAIQEVSAGTLQLSEGFINPNLFTTLSLDADATLNAIKIYPNPVSEQLYLDYFQAIDKVEIFDSLGKHVLSSTNTNAINVEALKTGIYIIKIYSASKIVTHKMIKI